MSERGFTEPVKVTDIEETKQTIKPKRIHQHEYNLMIYGAVVGAVVTLLFTVGFLFLVD